MFAICSLNGLRAKRTVLVQMNGSTGRAVDFIFRVYVGRGNRGIAYGAAKTVSTEHFILNSNGNKSCPLRMTRRASREKSLKGIANS